jgi:hypothetical protein
MPLNKLENFIKNYEGRILYVNSNDLDATDSITNQGNSLTKPFKTIQRAVLEAARFSFVPGENNDRNDRTTILVYPGEHLIDNRPGFGIRKTGTALAEAVSPSGQVTSPASDVFTLNLQSNFDLSQEDNILYKFNSVNGGVILPRGTSLIGLDLRKTKIRPKYVPNPTDVDVPSSAFFRITGNCFFWNFSIFDATQNELVYTDNRNFGFGTGNQSLPTFSHHKLTVFEYVDGVNTVEGFDLTDLDMYYAKLSNAYNEGSGREVPAAQKFPLLPEGFAKERSEWEIVGAFASDPIQVSKIISGDGATPGPIVQVTTTIPHNLTVDTPIKIRGCNVNDYNISTVVQSVPSPTTFTYLLSAVRNNLPADPGGSVTVTIDTDTVRGASPYIFNCSLRSVWGLNGMNADGSKASGFRSMVVAQYTAVSLQKDDRAFVKYDPVTRTYNGIPITKQIGSQLSSESASTNSDTVYHLDSNAVYRRGWETSHIKMSNDAIIQIVSVFAIGFNKHFDAQSGGDASITNSNSNFGQISLNAEGFKKEAFAKDDFAYITSVITPKHISRTEQNVDWISIDVGLTTAVGISSHLYLFGFNTQDNIPPSLIQGYRIGAKENDVLYLQLPDESVVSSKILMTNNVLGAGLTYIDGSTSASKIYNVAIESYAPDYDTIILDTFHNIQTGEKIIILSDIGDLPENITPNTVYYAIKVGNPSNQIKIASSFTNAVNGVAIKMYGGSKLKILSRVSDKESGELGSPIQYDSNRSNWFVHLEPNNSVYSSIQSLGVGGFGEPRTDVTFIKRIPDNRSLDEKIYKFRISIPKESPNSRDLSEGFVIQESSKTGPINDSEFSLTSINSNNYDYKRNPRFISTCSESSGTVTVITEKPHDLNIGDRVIISNVKSSTNIAGIGVSGYNGDFTVSTTPDYKTFTYSTKDNDGKTHNVGIFSGPSTRDIYLPRFERNDIKSNFYIYRVETLAPYIFNVQDGVYHAYVLKSDVAVPNHFTDYKYNQNVVDLYPQLDRDNINPNPSSALSYAKVSPLGEVVTNDLKKSITREALDTFVKNVGLGISITSVTGISAGVATVTLSKEHGLNGIVGYASSNFTSGHVNGTYYNVKLLNANSSWSGATAKVVVSGGSITSLQITDGGSGYQSGQTLTVDGFAGSTIGITNAVISSALNNSLQITGIGTADDGLYRIYDIPSKNEIGICKTSGDSPIVNNQYVFNVGPSTITSSTDYYSLTGISTFTFASNHGLLAGNSFRVLENSTTASNSLGDYVVLDVVGVTTFTAITNRSFPSTVRILKHGFNYNDLTSDSGTENLGTRGINFYANESAILNEAIVTGTIGISTFKISATNSGLSTTTRFSLGDYIQIDSEIMRISSSTLTGSGNNEITVLRGYFGTAKENHANGSLIKKVKPIPIELRRPSILRASGHTFEYLGYGPGNYSTGLPQIQVKTLTEREDFLVQSQERSGGSALYTGMNSDGDFFIGNTKYSSSSGQQTTFDIPIPTITGQNPSRLSVVFDEVIIKERVLVEGGKSKQILSQFDGPVTFNQNIIVNNESTKINGELISSNIVKLNNNTDSTSSITGSVIAKGGFGIAKSVNIGGNLNISGITTFNGEVAFNSGLVPDSFEDAYIGSLAKPWSEAHIGNIQIAVGGSSASNSDEPDRTITTSQGNLVLKSNSGITSVTDILQINQDLLVRRNTYLTGIATVQTGLVPFVGEGAYLGTTSLPFSELHVGELQLAVGTLGDSDSTITTANGKLILDSKQGTISILDNVGIAGITTIDQLLDANGGATIDNIRIGIANDNEIDTSTGNLIIDSAGGTVEIDDKLTVRDDTAIDKKLTVSGQTYLTGITTVQTGLVPFTDEGAYLGTTTLPFSELHVGELQLAVGGSGNDDNRITTATGGLFLDSLNGTTTIDDNAVVTGTLTVNSTSLLKGEVTLENGIVPDSDEGAYLGTTTLPFSELHVGELQLAVGGAGNNDNTITTATGGLFLDSLGGTTTIDDNAVVTGTLNVTLATTLSSTLTVTGQSILNGLLDANAGATIDNIRIGISNDNEIDTSSGNLTLDSTGGTTILDDDVQITGKLDITGTLGVGLVELSTGIRPLNDLSAYLGTSAKRFSESYIGNVRIAVGSAGEDDNTITTGSGNLVLNASSSTIKLNTNSQVSGTLSASGDVTVSSSTDSSSSSSSASIKTSGGVSIAKKLYVGESINASTTGTFGGDLLANSNTASSSGGAGALRVPNGGAYIGGNLYSGNGIFASGNVSTSGNFLGQLQYGITVAGSTFNNTGNVTVTLPDKTKITVVGAPSPTGFRADMNATRDATADTLAMRGLSGGIAFGSGGITCEGDITAFYSSDQRLKTNIELIDNALSKVCDISGVTFNWNSLAASLNNENPKDTTIREAGVIAQEVQKVLPEVVNERENGYLSVKYEQLVPLLIEAIKELSNKVEKLERKVL